MQLNQLSQEEQTFFETFIMITFAKRTLQNDLAVISSSMLKLKEPYLQLIHQTIDNMSKRLFEIKKQLHSRKIKIEFGKNDGTFTEFQVFFRGYVKTTRFLNAHLKNKVEQTIIDYFTGVSVS